MLVRVFYKSDECGPIQQVYTYVWWRNCVTDISRIDLSGLVTSARLTQKGKTGRSGTMLCDPMGFRIEVWWRTAKINRVGSISVLTH